jgi:hypothetical protein
MNSAETLIDRNDMGAMALRLWSGDQIPLGQAFRFFWGWYVTGFDPRRHCQPCLRGRRSGQVNRSMALDVECTLDEVADFDYFYVCGVSATGRWADNFHLAVHRQLAGDVEAVCYTGHAVSIRNAALIEIASLPDGFNGRDRTFTTCRNYQFGVQVYQFLPDGHEAVSNADGTYGRRHTAAGRTGSLETGIRR